MTGEELLLRLRKLDVRVWPDGEHLRVSAAKGVLTPALQAEITERRAELIALLRNAQGEPAPALTPQRHDGPVPLSFAQQRIWFLERLEPSDSAYRVAVSRWIGGSLDREAVEYALTEIVRRHEVLRTRFFEQDGEPVQIVDPPRPMPLPVIDLCHLPEGERSPAVECLVNEERQRRFDLATGPLIHAKLFRLGSEEHKLVLTMHHIVTDGWSLGVLDHEMRVLYEAFRLGDPSPLAPPTVQYADYCLWQRQTFTEAFLAEHLAYWRWKLAPPLATLALPLDRPRPARQSARGAWQSFQIPAEVTQTLRALARGERATSFMLLLAAFKVLLHRYTGQADIVVGSPIANRSRVETEGLIGFLANTLVLRTDLSGDPTFRTALARVRETALGAYAHQDMPFEKLVEKLQPERNLSRNPFFQVSFVLQPPIERDGLRVDNVASPFDVTLYMREGSDGLSGTFEYCVELFEASTIDRMIGHLNTLLASVAANADVPISQLPLLTPEERRWVICDLNNTATEYPRHRAVHELFEIQAERTPNATAVIDGERKLTYRELDQRANRIAHSLRELGVGPEVFVGVCVERSPDLIVALLAVLKAGGAYLPLDLSHPVERLAFMLDDAQAPVVLTQETLRDRIPDGTARVFSVDGDSTGIAAGSADAPRTHVSPEHPAYVMYTSGSTGTPKGVVVPHRAIVRLVVGTDYVALTSDDVVAQASNAAFDAATFEIWGALLNGARLAVLPTDVLLSPKDLEEFLTTHGITTFFITTALFNQCAQQAPTVFRRLKTVLFGGEAVEPRWVREVLRFGRPSRLLHVYGPTETTTFATWYEVHDVPTGAEIVPIGRPLANTRLYVLDPHRNPVPIGVTGELYIGGDALARGYLNRPALTDERFVPNPFETGGGERLYRTGDFVRYLPDGNIQFLGRVDDQVKVRGFRIELGEVEARLTRHPAVRQSVVLMRDDPPMGKRLVAYLLPTSSARPAADELRSFVASGLPEYMIPAAFVWLDQLPLTLNGKVDRHRLPAPPIERSATVSADTAPRDELEIRLTRLWEETLGVPAINRHDNFFDLGGHSLLAVRLFARLEAELGRKLPLALLFEAPSVERMAALLREQGWTPSWRSLVPIHSRGSKPPIFFLPGVGGNILGYAQLARALDSEQPSYGLQARGLDGKETPITRIEEIATHHIEEMRTVQPHGPYYLVGSCMGGLIAFEMAQQLTAMGERVDMLAMLDTWPPGATHRRLMVALPIPAVAYLRVACQRLVSYANTLARSGLKDQWAFIADKARLLWRMIVTRNALGDARSEINATVVERANLRALQHYILRPYPGRILYLLAGGREVLPEQDTRSVWRSYAMGGVEVHALLCEDSGRLLVEPYVGVVAECLRAYLHRQTGSLRTATVPERAV